MGLSIAQYIAKANKAEITLTSTVNVGTTVSVIFPVKGSNETITVDNDELS